MILKKINQKEVRKMLIDVHFHPDFYKESELKNLKFENVVAIANSINAKTHEIIISFSKQHKNCFFALGVYPEFATSEELLILDEYLRKNNDVIAIGEVGLDKTYENFENQLIIFKEIIKLSKRYDLPLIVHSRKAEKETTELLIEEKPKAIMHYFNGKFKLALDLQKNGFFLTIPSNVIINQHFQKFVNELDLNFLLPETDSPFLHPLKQWPNYPENVKYAYDYVSKVKQISKKEIECIFVKNFEKFFKRKIS
ncbi:MAG: TatD family hydrolase [Candidatus Woesearchaeota archaeon]